MKKNKELFIIRHGKAAMSFGNASDIDRALTEKGVNDGYEVAKQLAANNKAPELILSSPATRALHSALVFARSMEIPYDKILIKEEIYFSEAETILNVIRTTDNKVNSLMIFGHNPVFTTLANILLKEKVDSLPTTGVVNIKFSVDSWDKINMANLENSEIYYP